MIQGIKMKTLVNRSNDKSVKIVAELRDDDYANHFSHPDFTERHWVWGLGSDWNFYYIGRISGYSFDSNWHELDCNIPMNTKTIEKLAAFKNEIRRSQGNSPVSLLVQRHLS